MPDERHDLAWAEARFSDRIEGALDVADRDAFDALVERDPGVRAAFDAFRASVERLRGVAVPAAPDGFGAGIANAVAGTGATSPLVRPVRRPWMPWIVAAAAAGIAVWAWIDRPAPERIEVTREVRVEVPVERRVVEERRVEVPVEVPVEVRVEVPVERRVVEERVVRRLVPVPASIDTAPLAESIGRLVSWLDARVPARSAPVARARPTRAVRPVGLPPTLQPRRLDATPVAVIRDDDGTVHLDLAGRDDEVIPELLLLVDDPRAEVAMLAEDALHEIQARLTRRHEIPPLAPAEERTRVPARAGLQRLFRGSVPAAEETAAARWTAWWDANRVRIQRVSDVGSE